MDIHNRRALKQGAADALSAAREPQKLVAIYAGASALLSLALSLADLGLSKLVENTSGLSNLGTRSILETVQTVLPYAQMLLILCWDLGFLSAMLRIGRRQHTDEKELLSGFRMLGPALRCTLLQGLVYFGVCFAAIYLGTIIFTFTPLANPVVDALMPLMDETSMLSGEIVLDEAVMLSVYKGMIPAMVIMVVLFCAAALPLAYRWRMTNYCLLENPRAGAMAAMRASRAMMRGNCIQLLKLDLSFWWYYLLTVLASILCYGDLLLKLVGVELPFDATVSSFLFIGLYLVSWFAIHYCFRGRVEETYVMAYEAIRPKPQTGGVVLGNIFQM